MLRNPELILETCGHVVSGLSLDLSRYAEELGKNLAANVHSKDDLARDEAVVACRAMAAQCTDAAAIESLLQRLFNIYLGSEGKLTVAMHKISVLQGIDSLCTNGVMGASLQRLAAVAAYHFFKLLESEAVETYALWCAKFTNQVPKNVIDWFKTGPGLKTSTAAVRTAYIDSMSACFDGDTISQAAEFAPHLLRTVDKAIVQPTQVKEPELTAKQRDAVR